jgi:type III restriction enzyme
VTYEDGGAIKIVRPDFIFFAQRQDGSIAIDIVDPHGHQFGDALPKLRGLARYAEQNPSVYRRFEVVAQVESKFRTIDLTEASTRAAALDAESVKELYEGDVAIDYLA